MLHKLEQIDRIIKRVLFSAYIKGEDQPISGLIVGVPELGKTEELKQAILLEGILLPTDVTAFGILNNYAQDLVDKKIRHILITDLITPLSKRWETSSSFIAFLNNLVEEGIIEVRTYAFSKKFQQPIKCGIIACVTPEELRDKRRRWLRLGFMSRLMPISWSYTNPTQLEILNFITERKYRKDSRWHFKFPDRDVEVNLPPDLAKKLLPYTGTFAKAQTTYGFRYQKHLQRLAMSSAIIEGKDIVTQAHIDEVIELSDFLNLNYNKI